MALIRFGISLEDKLLRDFDSLIARKKYENRSEAIRGLIRDRLVSEQAELDDTETVGTITLVYSHDVRELSDRLNELQHRHHKTVISTMHIHLDEHNCLEVLVLKGRAGELREIADTLIATRGVKHGRLTLTTSGRDI